MDTINQMTLGESLCPVRSAAAIVKRNKQYPGTSQNSPISTVFDGGIMTQVMSDHVTDALQGQVRGRREQAGGCGGYAMEEAQRWGSS